MSTLCIADQLNILQSIASIARAFYRSHNPSIKMGHVSLPNSRDVCRQKMADVNGSSRESTKALSSAEGRVEELTQRPRKEGGGGEAGEAGRWKRGGGEVGGGEEEREEGEEETQEREEGEEEREGEGDLGLVISGNGGRDGGSVGGECMSGECVGGEGVGGEGVGGDSGQLRVMFGDVRKLDCSVYVSEGGRAVREEGEGTTSTHHITQSTHKEKDREEEGTLRNLKLRQRQRRREAREREREEEPEEEEEEEIPFLEHWDDALLTQAGENGQATRDHGSNELSYRSRNPLNLVGCVGRNLRWKWRMRREGRERGSTWRRGPEDLPTHHISEHRELESSQSQSRSRYLMSFGMGAGTFEVPFSF